MKMIKARAFIPISHTQISGINKLTLKTKKLIFHQSGQNSFFSNDVISLSVINCCLKINM